MPSKAPAAAETGAISTSNRNTAAADEEKMRHLLYGVSSFEKKNAARPENWHGLYCHVQSSFILTFCVFGFNMLVRNETSHTGSLSD